MIIIYRLQAPSWKLLSFLCVCVAHRLYIGIGCGTDTYYRSVSSTNCCVISSTTTEQIKTMRHTDRFMRADESEGFIYRLLWPVWGHPRWPKSNWWISNCLRVAVDLSSWSNNRWRYCCCCCCRPSPRKYCRPRCSYSIDNKRQLAYCCCCNSAISSCSRMKRPTPSTMISWDIEDSLPLLIRFDSIFPPSFTAPSFFFFSFI